MSELRARLFAVVGLAVFGMSMAVVGTTLGMSNSITADPPSAEFTLSENNLTLTAGDQERTVVKNMSEIKTVKISNQEGRFRIQHETAEPLTSAERARSIEIARQNDTLRHALVESAEYETSVEPIRKLNASTAESISMSGVVRNGTSDSEGSVFRVETISSTDNESVTIHRAPVYVENRTIIKIRGAGDEELLYSAEVDLGRNQVTDITDWADIRTERRLPKSE